MNQFYHTMKKTRNSDYGYIIPILLVLFSFLICVSCYRYRQRRITPNHTTISDNYSNIIQ